MFLSRRPWKSLLIPVFYAGRRACEELFSAFATDIADARRVAMVRCLVSIRGSVLADVRFVI
jgi:hypothetical protein